MEAFLERDATPSDELWLAASCLSGQELQQARALEACPLSLPSPSPWDRGMLEALPLLCFGKTDECSDRPHPGINRSSRWLG